MQQAYNIVADNLKAKFEKSKKRYDRRVKSVQFKLHSLVWYFLPRLYPGRGRKFRRYTSGPYRIERVLNDVNYVIRKTPTSPLITCHVDRITKYEGERPKIWINFEKTENQQSTENQENRISHVSGQVLHPGMPGHFSARSVSGQNFHPGAPGHFSARSVSGQNFCPG